MSIRSTSLEPKSQLTINLALKRKQKKEKIPDQKNRKKAKRENAQSKKWEKAKKRKKIPDQESEENRKNMQKRSFDQTISEQHIIVTK